MINVSDIMSSPVFSLYKVDTLLDVRKLMDFAKIRHIPVIDTNGNFEGLITHRDILAYTISTLAGIHAKEQEEIDKTIMIEEIMRSDVYCVEADMPLKAAAKILLKHKYGCLPVLEGKQLVGIITEADFLRLTVQLLETIEISKYTK